MPTLYLIDGHAQFYRAYHAIRTRMTSPVTKEPTQMTYGFVGMLLKVLRDYRPDYLAVVIDVAGDRESFRSEIFPEYKANRDPSPEDLGPQIERCLSILATMGVPVLGRDRVEADDVIASIVRRLGEADPDLAVRIVSRDKDLTQVLRPGVELFDVHRDVSVSPAEIFKTEGVEPQHVVDILSLMGDSIDNIPGVPGIGPKTAARLILDYGSIDNLYAHLEEIKGKRRENLEASRDAVPLAKSLVTLRDDLDVAFDLEAARVDPSVLPVTELLEVFRELDFRQHRDTLREITGSGAPERPGIAAADDDLFGAAESAPARRRVRASATDDAFETGLFAGVATPEPTAPETSGTYTTIADTDALGALVREVQAAGRCAVMTVLDGTHPMWSRLCGVAIAVAPESGAYVPILGPERSTHLPADEALAGLRAIFEDASIEKIAPDLKTDLVVLRRHGLTLRGGMFDTMIASYVVDATRSSHDIDVLALALLEHACIALEDLVGTGAKRRSFPEVALDLATPYAAERADFALRVRSVLETLMERDGLAKLFHEVEMPLVPVLAEIEFNGICVDPDELDRQRGVLQSKLDVLRASIGDAAPHAFNPDSPKQLAAALFNAADDETPGLGLRVHKRLKTGPSTDQEVLEKLNDDPSIETPLPGLILEYRHLAKLIGTYLVALKECIHPETGRVHARFHQTGAATGRLSSSDPNLQNIPIRTEVGREIRRAFVADPEQMLVTADYSQIELRLLAHLAEDPTLIDAFRRGEDVHTAVAAEVFGVAGPDVTAEQRSTAKMVNFGIVYGITAFGLARRLGGGMTNEDAQRIIDDYKRRYERIDVFLQQCVQQAHTHGYVETILGRRRLIPQVMSRRQTERAYGERMAINTVVQGSAADLIKVAMIDLHEVIPASFPEARMLLQIHDELVFEAPATSAEALASRVAERMSAAMDLRVPIEVKTACSTQWIDA